MAAAVPSGIPAVANQLNAGILETNVVRVHDPERPFYDSTGRSVVLMMRANTGIPDIGVMLRGVEREDGSLAIERLQRNGHEVLFTHIPGANLKFYLCYDEATQLFWLLHSQPDGRMQERRRLALSYSPDLLRWTFAGLVAVGPADNAGPWASDLSGDRPGNRAHRPDGRRGDRRSLHGIRRTGRAVGG